MQFVARLLSVLAVIGLLVVPVSTVLAETAMAAVNDTQAMGVMDHGDSMADMPCCPDQKPVKPECGKDCPLVTICTTSTATYLSKSDWTPISRSWSALDFATSAASAMVSLAGEPPARPPKA